jgi:hypothetical protein
VTNLYFTNARAVSALSGTLANYSTTSQMNDAISSEASTRSAADATLQGNINAEASTRSSADATLQGNINAEASTRSSADATLQGNINAEASARSAADATLQGNINTEASTRGAADVTLQNNINALGTTLFSGETDNRVSNAATVTATTAFAIVTGGSGNGNITATLSGTPANGHLVRIFDNGSNAGSLNVSILSGTATITIAKHTMATFVYYNGVWY